MSDPSSPGWDPAQGAPPPPPPQLPPPPDPNAGYGSQGPWNEQQHYGIPTSGPWAQGWYAGPRNDPMAVASLCLGIASFVCLGIVGSLAAVGLGIGAINRIGSQPQVYEGRSLAIAGIVLGALQTAMFIFLMAFGFGAPFLFGP